MDDQNNIECDPQQYRDEWFEIAAGIPLGREFELPNLSNTFTHSPLMEAQRVNSTSITANPNDKKIFLISPRTLTHANSTPLINKEIAKQELQEPKFEPHEHRNNYTNSCHLDDLKMSKIKAEAEDDDDDDDEGGHKCIMCNVKFANGNALGGHMSAHAKKRKMEVMRNSGMSIFKADGPFISGFGLSHKVPQGFEKLSNESPIVIDEDDMIERSKTFDGCQIYKE